MDDSDEEVQLINDVVLLNSQESQLKKAGCSCDENLFMHLSQDLDVKPLAKRLKLWRFRKELSQKIVTSLLSRIALSAATRETAATSLPVVEQETEHKRILKEPPFAVGVSSRWGGRRGPFQANKIV
jgi:hypothetical protein